MNTLHLYVLSKIELTTSVPFKNGFLATPDEGQVFVEKIVRGKIQQKVFFRFADEFLFYPFYFFRKDLHVYSRAFVTTHNGCSKVPAMRNRKMIGFIFQEWFTGISYANEIKWKSGKKITKQVTPRQVLQAFMRM